MLRRLWRLAAAALVLALLAAAGIFYWTLIRPLPQTSGLVSLPGAPAAAAGRDRLGVPHIEAASLHDALWVQGYVTAQDRLWQMDLLRRIPAGELAEILGPGALEADRHHRLLRMRHVARQAARSLPAQDLAAFEAYARGVNAYLETHRHNLPFEFQVLRYEPRPWEPSDTVLVALHMFRILTQSWRDDLAAAAAGERTALPASPGSNAWVVSGAHTSSGRPLLANDPHLEYSIPCIWYTVHLKTPELNVIGVSLPGAPGVIIGHNDRLAWGVTNLHFDVQDLYVTDSAEPAELEIIRVRGQPDVRLPVSVTRYGPVVTQVNGRPASLRWTAFDPAIWQFPFLDINHARNWEEFRAALARFPGPAQNFVYADVEGNIGYQVAGRLPVRRGFRGDAPAPGEPRFDWQGYIPFDDLPSIYNPPSGRLVTANQNPFPADYPYPVHGSFDAPYRSRRIEQLLKDGRRFEPADFLPIQTDVYSPFGGFFARAVVAALDRQRSLDPELAAARDQLRHWDGEFRAELSTPVLAAVTYNRFRSFLSEAARSGQAPLAGGRIDAAKVEELLSTRPPGWNLDFDELLLRSLRLALRDIRQRPDSFGTWGRHLETTFAHPVGHRLPVLRRFFDIGPFPQSGTTTTVKQTTTRLGPSMRLVVDLGDLDRSLHNLSTGQSGQPFSPHYKDQWEAYYGGRSFPLLFSSPEILERLTFAPASAASGR